MGHNPKRPFGGPEAVVAYLAGYTHRVAVSNSRLIALRNGAAAFNWKDYQIKGRDRQKTMTLEISPARASCSRPPRSVQTTTSMAPAMADPTVPSRPHP
jgi:hypothetical protein